MKVVGLVLFLLQSLFVFGQSWPRTERWEETICSFEEMDQKTPPSQNSVLSVGSSSLANWNSFIKRDLAPLPIIPRGFGGSTINDVVAYADRVVFPYKPQAILLYEGDNDINAGLSPIVVADKFRQFFELVHDELPGTCIYVISVKPSLARWHLWPTMKELNGLLALESARDDLVTYIDAASILIGENGMPRSDLFCEDQLHLNPAGYKEWAKIIRPVLMNGRGSL